jgi:YVTN family beta-propeller protein
MMMVGVTFLLFGVANGQCAGDTDTEATPAFAPIGDKTVDVGQKLEFRISAISTADELIFSAYNLPEGASFDPETQTFSWTPKTDQVGTYPEVRFTVKDPRFPTDPRYEDSQFMTITVNSRAPELDAIGDREVDVEQQLEFSISASHPGDDPLTFSAYNLPEGASFDPETQTFSWTPGLEQAGTYSNVRFEVSDGDLTDAEDITITVNAAPPPPPQTTLVIPVGGSSQYMALTPDGSQLLVVNSGPGGDENRGSISVIDTNTNTVMETIGPNELGFGFPFQIAISGDNRWAYLAVSKAAGPAVTPGGNRVTIIDLNVNRVVGTMSVSGDSGYGPVGLVLAQAGKHTYVTHRGLGRVDGFDNVAGSRYMSVADVGNSPVGVAVAPNGTRLYVASMGESTVTVIDIINEPYRILATTEVGLDFGGSRVFVAMAPDGSRVYVTDRGDSRIAVIDINPADGLPAGVSYIETNAASLAEMAISRDGTRAVVANDTDSVLVINLVNNTQIGEVPIGHSSFGVVYADLPGVVAYVSGGDTVWAITELP